MSDYNDYSVVDCSEAFIKEFGSDLVKALTPNFNFPMKSFLEYDIYTNEIKLAVILTDVNGIEHKLNFPEVIWYPHNDNVEEVIERISHMLYGEPCKSEQYNSVKDRLNNLFTV